MSLIAELEDMTVRMSPRFINNITHALDVAIEETTGPNLQRLKTSVSDFIGAVKIMGLDELKSKLEATARILDTPGPIAQALLQFRSEFSAIADDVPSDQREFLRKKEPPSFENMDVSIDREVVDRFMAIPGVSEERAQTLYFSGFTTIEDLKAASVAKLFGVSGMTLVVAKKIADHLNPDRLIRLETLTRDEDASKKDALSFIGKGKLPRDAEAAATDEVEPGEDAELLDLFLEQLTEYIGEADTIVQALSSGDFSSEILVHLEEITHGLVKAARYMGFEHTQSMAQRIETTVSDVISGYDQLSRENLIFLNDSIRQLSLGRENLKPGVEKPGDTREENRNNEISLEYNILTMAHYWGEVQDLYKDTHNLLRTASEQGSFSDEDIARLRKNTNRLDEMAGSISDIVESLV
ncbi:MAG: Hpt domain-containing protein [Deltaproteobacteria bacterium]|nr:Hpt domain-containing protein [Candidatus Zymogenaceae bacterium]